METEEKTQETTEVVADDSAQAEPEKSEREMELEQEITRITKESKAHQTTATRKSEEARRWQTELTNTKSQNEALSTKVDVLAEMFEESLNTEEYSEPKRKSSYQERIESHTKKQPEPKNVVADEHKKSVAQEIYALTDGAGKPFDKTPEFDRAYDKFYKGDADYALELVKEITEKMTEEKEKPKESEEARIDRLVNEKLKEIAKDKGELDSKDGVSSGSTVSDDTIRKNYRDNPGDPKVYRAYRELKAREAGY